MEPGRMRHTVAVQRLEGGRNEYGEPAVVRASIQPVSGRDFAAALQEQAEVTHKVTIRYNPAVKASMRVLYGERVLTILHIIDNWELHHEMVLMCREVL